MRREAVVAMQMRLQEKESQNSCQTRQESHWFYSFSLATPKHRFTEKSTCETAGALEDQPELVEMISSRRDRGASPAAASGSLKEARLKAATGPIRWEVAVRREESHYS